MSLFSIMYKRFTSLIRQQCGVAYIEFAISITMLLIMFYGAIEVTRYILIVQKVEKTVDTLTDVLTQSVTSTVSNADISVYLNAAQQLMNPYTFGPNGNVILSDLSTPSGSASPITINWQVCGGGTLPVSSTLGGPGATVAPATLSAALGGGFTMNAGEEVVVGEIFYNFTPILTQSIVTGAQVYRTSVFKLRFTGLSTDTNITSNACP